MREIKQQILADLQMLKVPILLTAGVLIILQLLFGTVCPMRILFGIDCPGCGLTRAGICVLTLKWKQAWQYNPTIFLWIPGMVTGILYRYIFPQKAKWMTANVGITLAVTIGRYIYCYRNLLYHVILHCLKCFLQLQKAIYSFIKLYTNEGGNIHEMSKLWNGKCGRSQIL